MLTITGVHFMYLLLAYWLKKHTKELRRSQGKAALNHRPTFGRHFFLIIIIIIIGFGRCTLCDRETSEMEISVGQWMFHHWS